MGRPPILRPQLRRDSLGGNPGCFQARCGGVRTPSTLSLADYHDAVRSLSMDLTGLAAIRSCRPPFWLPSTAPNAPGYFQHNGRGWPCRAP